MSERWVKAEARAKAKAKAEAEAEARAYLAAAAVLGFAAGCGSAHGWLPGAGCTEVGCSDATGVELVADGWPAGRLEVEAEIGGEILRCELDFADERFPGTCDDFRSRVQPSAQAPEAVLVVFGRAAPGEEVVVRLLHDGAEHLVRRFTPEYESWRPNGVLCPPECLGATERIEVTW